MRFLAVAPAFDGTEAEGALPFVVIHRCLPYSATPGRERQLKSFANFRYGFGLLVFSLGAAGEMASIIYRDSIIFRGKG